MSAPNDRKYQSSHEWALEQDGHVVVGITAVAVERLSDLVFVDLPTVGKAVTQGEVFGEIESVKAVSDLISPISGEVVEVHDSLADELDALAQDPYGAGWMIKVKPADGASLDSLMDSAAYDKHAAEEH